MPGAYAQLASKFSTDSLGFIISFVLMIPCIFEQGGRAPEARGSEFRLGLGAVGGLLRVEGFGQRVSDLTCVQVCIAVVGAAALLPSR